MFNYPFYTNPSYYTAGMGNGLLGGSSAGGLLRGIASKWSWNGFLTSTGKTLNVINQAIPIFYQVRPIVRNAKTMFRVMNEFKKVDEQPVNTQSQIVPSSQETQTEKNYTPNTKASIQYTNEPTFFI